MKNIIEFKKKNNILWRKIDILCHGLREDEKGVLKKYYKAQNPHETKRTGNAGLQIKLGEEKLALNVAVYKKFCEFSPYTLIMEENNLFVYDSRDKEKIKVCCPDYAPFWYEVPIYCEEEVKNIGDFILLEGDSTAILSITKGCYYFNLGKPCAFCAIGSDSNLKHEKNERKQSILLALEYVLQDEQIDNFHLTGGNTLEEDRGALEYIDYVDKIISIRKDAKIAIEIPPPEVRAQEEVFKKLKDHGVDSITINIEFWNDEKRRELMPIKGYINKEEYISAYKVALKYFGKNKVTCGFIVGLEDKKYTKLGIDTLASLGVITEVYPFKPNSGSVLENEKITKVEDIIEISLYANDRMKKFEIAADKCSGCVKCGACGLTQQLIKL